MGNYSRGTSASLPGGTADLAHIYDSTERSQVATDDGIEVPQSGSAEYLLHQFKIPASGNSTIVTWDGQSNIACSISPTQLQIYNYTTGLWELIPGAYNDTAIANVDFTLTGTVGSLGNYISGGEIVVRVWQFAGTVDSMQGTNVLLHEPFDSILLHGTGTPTFTASVGLVYSGAMNGNSSSITWNANYFKAAQGTLALWIKPLATGWGYYFWIPPNILFYYHGDDQRIVFQNNFNSDDKNILAHYKDSNTLNVWKHLAMTWHSNVVRVYVNGENISFNGVDTPYPKLLVDYLSTPTSIQWRYFAGANNYVNDFYIWDFPLSDAEVLALYTSGATPTLPTEVPGRVHAQYLPATDVVYVTVDMAHSSISTTGKTADIYIVHDSTESYIATVSSWTGSRAVTGYVALPTGMTTGTIFARAKVKDSGNNIVSVIDGQGFDYRAYVWKGTNIGVSDDVIAPFTAMVYDSGPRTITCVGRTYTFKADGLPQKFNSAGADFTGAMTLNLTIGGSAFTLGSNWTMDINLDGKKVFRNNTSSGGNTVLITGTMEQDGFITYEVTITPGASAIINSMNFNIPMPNASAQLYHVVRDLKGGAQSQGNSESAYLPASGTGTIWGSSTVSSQKVLGSFIPYIWVGDWYRGVAWMANSDKNWSINDTDNCVEITRNATDTTMTVNFVKNAKTVTAPVTYKFGIMATPGRPYKTGIRAGTGFSANFNSNWEKADQTEGFGRPLSPVDWENYALTVRGGIWGIIYAYNDVWGPAAHYPGYYSTNFITDPITCEENEYFTLEWRGTVQSDGGQPSAHMNDYQLYWMDHYMDSTKSGGYCKGIYMDDCSPIPSYNQFNDTGYLRSDGKYQCGYRMWDMRDFHKRSAWLFRHYSCPLSMMAHITDTNVLPVYGWWELKLDMEWDLTTSPNDTIDTYDLGFVASRIMGNQYGMMSYWLSLPSYTANHWDDWLTYMLLHDISQTGGSLDSTNWYARVTQLWTDFDIGNTNVSFKGYWELQNIANVRSKDLKISAWVNPVTSTALVIVGNLTGADITNQSITLPFTAMGMPAGSWVYQGDYCNSTGTADGNAKTGGHYPHLATGDTLNLTIYRHNYVALLVGPASYF